MLIDRGAEHRVRASLEARVSLQEIYPAVVFPRLRFFGVMADAAFVRC